MKPSLCLNLHWLSLLTGLIAALPTQTHSAETPPGFVALFNGLNLDGWRGGDTFDPRKYSALPVADQARQAADWTAEMLAHWRVESGELVNDGQGKYATTVKDYGDFELLLEYKTVARADSGVYLRGCPQVQIWDSTEEAKFKHGAAKGSGGLWNNSPGAPGKDPLVKADKPFGEWNQLRILMVGARVSVWLNDQPVVSHAVLENYFNRNTPVPARGPIQLQTHGGEIRWRNLFIREIGPDEANAILTSHGETNAFKHIFNGRNFGGWAGPTDHYEVQEGSIVCKPKQGGTIYFNELLTNFVARVEFKLPPGGNNGLAIRYPGEGDPACVGMCELQVLDSEHAKYAKLDPRQFHGSAYGMIPAHRGYLRPTGEWNFQEVTVNGSTLRVELNGTVILDGDLSTVTEFIGDHAHPGKNRTAGYFGFAGHNDPVAFRNVQIRPLQAAEHKQPNILFIFTDDHALAALSAYGDARQLVQTPNLDRIAREGMIFHRAMVPNSICGPSRATVLTGKYSHLNGFYDNSRSVFDGSQPTMPKLLQAAGYQTALIGKWHLVSDPTGFDYWDILPGQGRYYNPPMIRRGTKVNREGYVTDVITDLSLDWLKERDKSKPFLLMCQQKAPHREWSPNLKNLGWNGDRKFPEPETLFDDYSGRGQAVREQDMTLEKTFSPLDAKLVSPAGINAEQLKVWNAYYEPRNENFRQANLKGHDLVRWRYQRYLHDYLGCVLSVDESVGRLLQYLDDEGLAENTIVVYSSDQGFYLGEHGWFDKRWIFEESLRTPLLIRWPGKVKPGSASKELVSNLDFASTLLEAAGQPIPADIQGRSLVPILTGHPPADWRKSFYYHYYEYPGAHSVRRHYGVVTDRYKLVHYYEPEMNYWELFDLQKDPHELRSAYGQPDYAATQKELHNELIRLRKELKVPEQDPEITYPKKN